MARMPSSMSPNLPNQHHPIPAVTVMAAVLHKTNHGNMQINPRNYPTWDCGDGDHMYLLT
eukprot:scaffold86119_cov105-Attheya_sp.AAC.1